jgi:ketosteroid isomerase-like protein
MNFTSRCNDWIFAASFAFLLALGATIAVDRPATGDETAREETVAPARRNQNAKIKQVLTAQRDAWNRGNIDEFMEFYWKSKDLAFSSGGTTTRGWKETKAGYKKRYATREEMGTLTFDQLEVTFLGEPAAHARSVDSEHGSGRSTSISDENVQTKQPLAALVLGRWHLKRETDSIGGNFSLVFRLIDEKWLIIHDHTSLNQELGTRTGS